MVDVVTPANEELYRRAFAIMQKHSMECIEETVADMAQLLTKVCCAFGVPVEEILKQITVEQFEYHLKKILDSKDCSCNNST